MNPDPVEAFAGAAADLCGLWLDGGERSLEERVLGVNGALAAVLAAGARLPVAPAPPGGSGGLEASWPGFGSFERYWTVGGLAEPGPPAPVAMSETLAFVVGELWTGLLAWQAGDAERALGWWSRGYESSWGPAASELAFALHPRAAAYRRDRRTAPRARGPSRAPSLSHVASREEARPMLGVRFEPEPGGARVVDVHPRGPASGRLCPGDLVIAVDGHPLAAADEATARRLLVGPIGALRRYEVRRGDQPVRVELASVSSIPG